MDILEYLEQQLHLMIDYYMEETKDYSFKENDYKSWRDDRSYDLSVDENEPLHQELCDIQLLTEGIHEVEYLRKRDVELLGVENTFKMIGTCFKGENNS